MTKDKSSQYVYTKNQFNPFLFCFTSSLSQALTFLRPNSSEPSLTVADLLATLHSPIFSPFATLHSPAISDASLAGHSWWFSPSLILTLSSSPILTLSPFATLHSPAVRDDSIRRRFSLSHCRQFSLSHHSQRFTCRPIYHSWHFTRRPFVTIQSVVDSHFLTVADSLRLTVANLPFATLQSFADCLWQFSPSHHRQCFRQRFILSHHWRGFQRPFTSHPAGDSLPPTPKRVIGIFFFFFFSFWVNFFLMILLPLGIFA